MEKLTKADYSRALYQVELGSEEFVVQRFPLQYNKLHFVRTKTTDEPFKTTRGRPLVNE